MTDATPPLRVLHIASGDAWGGAEVVIDQIVAGLRSTSGVHVEALLLNEGALAGRLRAIGVPVTIVDESRTSFAGLRRAVRRAADTAHWDVVHTHRYKELLLALAIRPHPARVVTIHGMQPFGELDCRSRIQIWAALWLGRLAGAYFAAVSPELEARLTRVFGHRQVVRVANPIPDEPAADGPAHGVADLRAQNGWPETCGLVAFVGRLEAVKGPDLLLDVASRCAPATRFVVMGDGSMASALRRRIEQTDALRDRVALLGEVERPARYFDQLDALVLSSRHEGQPMVVLEAADAGLPVAAFAVGGVPELLRDAPRAWLAAPEDVAALAAVVDEMTSGRAEARRAADSWSTALRARHGRSAVIEQYLTLYRRAARAPATGAGAAPAAPAE